MKYLLLSLFSFLIFESLSFGRGFTPIKSRLGIKNIESANNQLKPLSRAFCTKHVRKMAASYGSDNFKDFLSQDFPNGTFLSDAFKRITFKVTNIKLRIESFNRVTVGNWQKVVGREGVYSAECITDMRTRLIYDNAATGNTVVRSPGRSQWKVEFVVRENQ